MSIALALIRLTLLKDLKLMTIETFNGSNHMTNVESKVIKTKSKTNVESKLMGIE